MPVRNPRGEATNPGSARREARSHWGGNAPGGSNGPRKATPPSPAQPDRGSQVKTIDIRRDKLIEEGIDPDRLVAYWAEKGITVVWAFPAGQRANRTKVPANTPTRNCPGCKKDVELHEARWERGVTRKGMLGPWKKFCRPCDAKAHGRECVNCNKIRPKNSYLGRGRYCHYCRETPIEKRRSKCTRCLKSKKGPEFKWMKSGRAESWCRKCYSEIGNAIGTKKFHESSKPCRECRTILPRADFAIVGTRRSHFCPSCTQKRETAQNWECSTCHVTRPIEEFRRTDKHSKIHLNSVCVTCRKAVQSYKKRRRRAKEAAKRLASATPAPNSR